MIQVTRIALDDVLEIVRLRDERKLSWLRISELVGYLPATCSKHYYIYKSPEPKFYMSEFFKALKKLDVTKMTTTDAYNLAKAMGYRSALGTFRTRPDIVNQPFKYSTEHKRRMLKAIYEDALKYPNKSLRDLVWEYFDGYTYSWKLNILKQLSED